MPFGPNTTASPVPVVTCHSGHVTHVALACDPSSLCSAKVERRGQSQTATCRASVTHTAPYFRCRGTGGHVPYSVVCDWSTDCGDNSDEAFCHFPPCGTNTFNCGQGQCISVEQVCDNIVNCKTVRDELSCKTEKSDTQFLSNKGNPPALVNLDRPGSFSLVPLPGNSTQCPDSHYLCPTSGNCLPVYTRCNGMADCPGHGDEAGCDVFTCEGFYRCRGTDRRICMHVSHLCDGWPQCPRHDDELMCRWTESCPDRCVCYGATFTDSLVFQAETFPKIRYLEGRASGLTMNSIVNQTMLIYLGAGACGWKNVSDIRLPNLHVLDISDNMLLFIDLNRFSLLPVLTELDLSGNPLSSGFSYFAASLEMKSLLLLNLSRVSNDLSDFLEEFTHIMPQVEIIDFSHSSLTSLKGRDMFTNLKVLDLQGCTVVDFSPEFMKGMDNLQQVLADNFKLCCPAVLPDDFLGQCTAPADEISSCDNLLKSGFYRAALVLFLIAALLGNQCSFVYRLWSSSKRKTGYSVFVLHLCVSDFFMGVYLSIIGLADRIYAGTYLWNDCSWKGSTACSISGFVSLLSCEVSSILICLITLDRFLVIRFPFSRLRFRATSAHAVCAVSWGLGMILASIPLLPVTSHWAFYRQTGICIPLPVTRGDFPGRHYSFAVMIVFNLVMFLSIATGQALIYWSVRANAMPGRGAKSKDNVISANDSSRSKEATIARRLLIVAMSDFLCWFPIGVCGLLAKLDVTIPGEVNTALAVFVLPFNSALNPFLYTYTTMRERRHKEKENTLHRFISVQVKTALEALNH